jgi:DNA segregation ATPase FtsK/SpoIIIE, S-DNA-T family
MLVNGARADDLAGRGLTTLQRWVVPLWLSIVSRAFGWFVRSTWRASTWLVARPLLVLPLVLLLVGFVELGARGFWTGLSLVMLAAGAWLGVSPSTFDRRILQRLRGWWRWVFRYRRVWYPALEGCGLARITPERKVFVPKVRKVTSTRWVDTLHVRLLHGHTPEDLAKQSEGLRHAFGALRCTVVEDRPGRVRVVMFVRDPLAQVVPAVPLEDVAPVPNLDAVPVGRTEFGQSCTLKLAGTHHIVAAATGAGKSTLTWNVVRALGPGIASGLVRVTGLDPKGGMELYPGRPLFTYYEDDSPAAIADALDNVVLRMAQRKQRLRGASRDWSMSLDEPFELVIVDELAALTAYVPDRRLRERIAGSLQMILSQGRALGFCVLACVQDPRKEILPFRDLYPTRIALRVTEDSHSNLTLGDGAKERGALCHLIREDTPGVGYLRLDGVAEPVRVRFGHVTDADIAAMAALWPAPPLTVLPAAEPAFTSDLPD